MSHSIFGYLRNDIYVIILAVGNRNAGIIFALIQYLHYCENSSLRSELDNAVKGLLSYSSSIPISCDSYKPA